MQEQAKWVLDPSHTKVGFSVRHFGISETDGFFRNYTGTIKTEKEDFSDLQVNVTVQIDSIDTNDAQRDAHLKANDFFNAEKFPEMKFESIKLEIQRQREELVSVRDKLKLFHSQKLSADKRSTELLAANSKLEVNTRNY